MPAVKRVAVIGAGASGLTATKSCLDEGLEPVCFERTDDVGGLWLFTEKVRDGQSCVMNSTITNTTKEMSSYSDFPPPKEFPNLMHHTVVQEYLRKYTEHFRLDRHIRFNTEITQVRRSDDFADTGRWTVSSVDHETGQSKSETYDAVLVCSGHHAEKHLPPLPGLSDFQGHVTHSRDYRPSADLQGKQMLVVGLGNSGGDIAAELSTYGQVYLSTRRGSWLYASCIVRDGINVAAPSRFSSLINGRLPRVWLAAKAAATMNQYVDHDLFALTPDVLPGYHSSLLNTELVPRIACGRVKVVDDVKRFTRTGVEFKDGTYKDIDMVVFATGYVIGFPFIEKEVLDVKENHVLLYKYMFPPDLQHPTLAVIGCIQPNGSLWPTAELQSRLATRVFKGSTKLPCREAMWKEIHQREQNQKKNYVRSMRHTVEVGWLGFLDGLAAMIGCKPNIRHLLLTDPVLGLKVLFGPALPYHFRLQGPGRWSGARHAILTAMDRIRFPLQTRPLPTNRHSMLVKVAQWVYFPPASFVLLLEAIILVLLLRLWWC